MESIIVFSHLRWNFVFQRPQQLMSRLASHYRIVFVEEPGPLTAADGREDDTAVMPATDVDAGIDWQLEQPLPQVTVMRPVTRGRLRGFHQPDTRAMRVRMRDLRRRHPRHIAWLYTPMALPLLEELDPCCVVYDCMDELSCFLKAPPGILAHEQALLRIADLVFTGGPSLHEAKRGRHPNVHCFPSAVDAAHFRQALDRNLAHPAMQSLPSPRLGFFGVLDERFDTALVAAIADRRPDWQLVLVGPVAKIDPAALPTRPNIHYAGQQAYAELPAFLAAWDLCLMPFAINAATRYISPTKSLEYMAAELPIVSTPVRDVVRLHRDVVDIAGTVEDFIACCERALAMPAPMRQQRIRAMRRKLAATSWDGTAQAMHALLVQQLQAGASAGGSR